MTKSTFNQELREKVFDNVVSTVERKLYDPGLNGVDWRRVAAGQRNAVISSQTPEEFETGMNELIRELHVSHAGFFSEKRPLAAAKIAIGATFYNGGAQWIFQDVHPGGPAHNAGIQPGDTLLTVSGAESKPPKLPTFALGESVAVDVERRSRKRETSAWSWAGTVKRRARSCQTHVRCPSTRHGRGPRAHCS